MRIESVSSPFSVSEEVARLEGILVVRPHDLLENERTSVSDAAGSAGAETAFSLGLLAELAAQQIQCTNST